MKVVKFGKCKVVFGANWTTLPGSDSQEKEIRIAAKDVLAQYYVAMAREGSRPLVGLIASTQGRDKNYSAAALIPLLLPNTQNAVFGFLFEDGAAGAICFLDGLPMVGFDVVGTPATVAERISEFILSLGEESGSVVFRGESSLFGDRAYLEEIDPFDFAEQDFDNKEFKSAIFSRAAMPSALLFALALLVVVVVGGYYGYDNYQKEEARKRQMQQIDPNVAYEINLKAMLADAGFSANKSVRAISPQVGSLPKFLGGWVLDGAECQTTQCVMTWGSDKAVPSTFDGFKSELPSDWSATYKGDFQTINTIVPITTKVVKGVDRELLPHSDMFLISMGTEVQRLSPLGIDFQIKEATIFAIPSLPQGQPPITETVLKKPVKEGTWSISGPWWALGFVETFQPSMTMTSLKLSTRGRDITIHVEGKYYVTK